MSQLLLQIHDSELLRFGFQERVGPDFVLHPAIAKLHYLPNPVAEIHLGIVANYFPRTCQVNVPSQNSAERLL